jgi:hypothetical protein
MEEYLYRHSRDGTWQDPSTLALVRMTMNRLVGSSQSRSSLPAHRFPCKSPHVVQCQSFLSVHFSILVAQHLQNRAVPCVRTSYGLYRIPAIQEQMERMPRLHVDERRDASPVQSLPMSLRTTIMSVSGGIITHSVALTNVDSGTTAYFNVS